MLSARRVSEGLKTRPERHRPSAVLAFVAEHLSSPKAQKVALQILASLFELSRRYGRPFPTVERSALDAEYERWEDRSSDEVHGWRFALPIAVPSAEREQVSRVIGAVMAAADPRFRAPC